jgi:type III secretion system YscQ/HrcQ family protein
LTPVESGILTFVAARLLDDLQSHGDPLGLGELVLDHVGQERFGTGDLGAVVTLRWIVRVAGVTGAARLWIPAGALIRWLDDAPAPATAADLPAQATHLDELASQWRAVAGTIVMSRGLSRLRAGGVLPIDDRALQGTPHSPQCLVQLTLALADPGARLWFAAEPVPQTGGGSLRITRPLQNDPIPREAVTMSPADEFAPPSIEVGPPPTDIPVTLAVELGRVNLTLARLADLRPGDVVELGRHSREPVELTSGGRLVARGELVQIDTELGVRVTHVFL